MATLASKAIRPLAICLVLLSGSRLEAASVTVGWDANTETDIAGYTLVYGTQSGVYPNTLNVGNVTSYTLTLNAAVYYFAVRAVNTAGLTSALSGELRVDLTTPPPPANFLDSDGRADLVVWRPGNGTWYSARSSAGYNSVSSASMQWGNQALGDVPFMGDIDGDHITDLIVWRASTATWFWVTSSTSYAYSSAGSRQWGSSALGDIPMVGDLDGDGKSDLVVWRPTDGTWYWLRSTNGYSQTVYGAKQWGNNGLGDKPMLGDMDGDGKADLVVWRASTATWYWLTSSSGYLTAAAMARQWGSLALGDIPKVADLDGDGKGDLVVWRPTDGTWYWLKSSNGYAYTNYGVRQWGSAAAGDIPLLGDIDGDGKADLVVWRKPTGTWYWLTSLSGYSPAAGGAVQWGSGPSGDIPMIR